MESVSAPISSGRVLLVLELVRSFTRVAMTRFGFLKVVPKATRLVTLKHGWRQKTE
jgi:hypothetical protein